MSYKAFGVFGIGLFRLGIITLSIASYAFAQSGQEPLTPEKVFAILHSRADIPCLSSAPISEMKLEFTDQAPSITSRIRYLKKAGDTNLLMMAIERTALRDAGKFVCTVRGVASETELVVYKPKSPAFNLEVTPSNNVKVNWTRPDGPEGVVQSYTIYVTEVADSVGVAHFKVPDKAGTKGGKQEFLLLDLKPGAIYDIEMRATYLVGSQDAGEGVEGPGSKKLRITIPHFSPPPLNVKVVAWTNSSILVMWTPPNTHKKAIDGYRVVYKPFPVKKSTPGSEVNVTSLGPDNQWNVVLAGLKTRVRYEITVAAYQNNLIGKESQAVIFRHDGFAPELSINAIAIGPTTVMVTLDTVGGNDVKKLRVLYSDDSAAKWTRMEDCDIGGHCIIGGLQPRSTYYFSARARVHGKSRHLVTHLQTPPKGPEKPLELSVKAKTDRSIRAEWSHDGEPAPIGYILQLEVRGDQEREFRPFQQKTVLGAKTTEMGGLQAQDQYRAQVVPFDASGMGIPSETVLFRIGGAVDPGKAKATRPTTFIEVPAPELQVDAGEDMTLPCSAVGGDTYPMVLWRSSDGSIISNPSAGRNVLRLYNVRQPMNVTCEASNMFSQQQFYTVRIDVSHGLKNVEDNSRPGSKPKLKLQIPPKITLPMNKPLYLRCSYTGVPGPLVRWTQNGRPVGQWSPLSSSLAIPSVQSSAILECQGKNEYGFEKHIVELTVEDKDGSKVGVANGDYTVSMRHLQMSPDKIVFKWAVDEGDMDAITHFQIHASTEHGVVLADMKLGFNHRSFDLQKPSPGLRYKVNLKTMTRKGVVAESNTEVIPDGNARVIDEPVLLLEVVEIREGKARADFTALTRIRHYRVRVKDLSVRNIGNTILDETLSASTDSIIVDHLKPNRDYQVILDATSARTREAMTTSVRFQTPSEGKAGISVASRSDQQSSTTAATVSSTTPIVTSTQPPTTTTVKLSTARPRLATKAPAVTKDDIDGEEKEDKGYDLRVKTVNKTPYQADIRWAVVRGDLATINNFLVTIKGQFGRVLLSQLFDSEKRSLTLQVLEPSSRYFVEIQARTNINSVLTQSDTVLITPSAGATMDTSNPVLDLEATEIRTSRATLEWTLVNGDRRKVAGYRVRVLDTDERGANMLTQNLDANSNSINLKQLLSNIQLHVIVDALDRSGHIMASASVTFTTPSPGRYGTPVKSSRSQPRGAQNIRVTTTEPPYLSEDPVLDLEIHPELPDAARLNWTWHAGRGQPVRLYELKTRLNGARGQLLIRQPIPANVNNMHLQSLSPDTTYYVELEALDKNRNSLAKVSTSYLLPPPGRNVEPIKVSSSDPGSGEDSAGEVTSPKKMVIQYISAVNSTAALVEWRNPSPVSPRAPILIRYAEFEGNTRHGYIIKYSLASPGKATVTGLTPGKTYGFQIATPVPTGQYMQWSKMVLYTSV